MGEGKGILHSGRGKGGGRIICRVRVDNTEGGVGKEERGKTSVPGPCFVPPSFFHKADTQAFIIPEIIRNFFQKEKYTRE